MDFIDENDVARREVGKDRCEVTDFFDRRARCDLHLSSGFFGDQMCEGGFTQARWSVEKDVFCRMIALFCCAEKDFEVLFDGFLANILFPGIRTERLVKVAIVKMSFIFLVFFVFHSNVGGIRLCKHLTKKS